MPPLPPPLEQALRDPTRPLTAIVVRLAALGDILRTIPAVRLVRRAVPHMALWWVVDDRWRPALEGHPDLAGTVALPRRAWQRRGNSPLAWPARLRDVRDLRRRLRALRADLVLDFHGNLRSGMVGRLSGAPVRLGYSGHQAKEGNQRLTTHRVEAGSRRQPRIERNLDLVRALGLPDSPLPLGELPLARAGAASARGILQAACSGGETAVINPGASAAQAYKKPPAELLAAAAARLAERGLTPLVVWGPSEEPDARQVVARAGGSAVLAPPTDLPTLAALIDTARAFVGGDSGPMHMACLLGCPVLALYGGTDPEVNGPWGVPSCSVFPTGRLYTGIKRVDREAGGFEGIRADQVRRAVDDLLDQPRPG